MDLRKGKIGMFIVAVIVIVLIVVFVKKDKNDDMTDVQNGNSVSQEILSEYKATIKNISSDQVLAPGVYIVHTSEASLNFVGSLAPETFEGLAEVGDPEAFAEYVATLPGVSEVIEIKKPVLPGESSDFEFEAEKGSRISGVQMAVGSNDGYALVDAIPLQGRGITAPAVNHDAGTEENSPLNSGFDGGQPDPSKGGANIENGVATDPVAPVSVHDQLTEVILEFSLEIEE